VTPSKSKRLRRTRTTASDGEENMSGNQTPSCIFMFILKMCVLIMLPSPPPCCIQFMRLHSGPRSLCALPPFFLSFLFFLSSPWQMKLPPPRGIMETIRGEPRTKKKGCRKIFHPRLGVRIRRFRNDRKTKMFTRSLLLFALSMSVNMPSSCTER